MKHLFDPWLRPSLFRRLYVCAIGVLAALSLAQGLYLYTRLVRADGQNVVEELSQTADAYAQLLSTPGLPPEGLAQQARRLASIKIGMTPMLMSENDFRYSVWSDDDRLLAHSEHGTLLSRPSELNRVLESRSEDEVWLSYAAQSADGQITVVIAQPQSIYWRAAKSMSLEAGRVILVAALVLAALIGLGTHAGLAPLRKAAASVQQRDANDLAALELPTRYLEITPLVDAINVLFARVGRMLQAERSFFADAAHELRTPLAALGTQAWALAHARSEAERQQALVPLEQGVARNAELLAKLLTLSRLEALEPSSGPGGADLATLARERMTQLAGRAHARGIEISYEGPRHAATVLDAHAAISVLDNLLENALRHSPEGGRIDVCIETIHGADVVPHVRLSVADTGAGVPVHERERVFHRFYRVPGTTGEGSGLGLAIVKRVVELHHGRVRIDDSPCGGATFVLELPGTRVPVPKST